MAEDTCKEPYQIVPAGRRGPGAHATFNLILYAVPFFVGLLAIEWLSVRHLGEGPASEDQGPRGYDAKDTATSIGMGLGNLVINAGWKLVVAAVYVGVYELTPLRIPSGAWWAWVLLFFADDLAYYWFHRVSHEVRVFWASHVVHHSSQYYNLSTALRQTWVPMTSFLFWIPLAVIGMPPWMIILEQSISLVFQFLIHTERVGRLPRPVEAVMNTPSHHRVHHGANDIYLDRNYGGVLIIWDRLFGTFQGETECVRYGLTKNIDTHVPTRIAFHEYASWRDRAG